MLKILKNDEKLWNQNKIFENQFLETCLKMGKENKHVGFENKHRRMAMQTMQQWSPRLRASQTLVARSSET